MGFRWNAVCIDCDPDQLDQVVAFYIGMTGLAEVEREARWVMLAGVSGAMGINVQADDAYRPPVWPESSAAQAKMMHFEVQVEDVTAAVAEAVALGARQAEWQPPDRDPSELRVMLDPAGHPFCLWS